MVNKNQSGFSLIEVLVATAIMTIAALAFSNMFISQTQSLAFLEDKYSRLSLNDRIKLLLGSSDSCQKTLQGIVAATGPLNVIKNAAGVTELSTQPPTNIYEKLKIVSIQLINVDVPDVPNSSGRMRVMTTFERIRASEMVLRPIDQEIVVTTDANKKITSCSILGEKPLKYNYSSNRGQWNEESAIVGNIGAGRNCFARVVRFDATYRYNSAGCFYQEASGDVVISGKQTIVDCEVLCYK